MMAGAAGGAGRAMGADPAAGAAAARADPVGLADRRRGLAGDDGWPTTSTGIVHRLCRRLARLRLHPAGLHRRREPGRAARPSRAASPASSPPPTASASSPRRPSAWRFTRSTRACRSPLSALLLLGLIAWGRAPASTGLVAVAAGLGARGRSMPGQDEADAADRPHRVALQRLLDLLIFVQHLRGHRGAGLASAPLRSRPW